ncbi:MAG: AAA family ATPase, partial [Candidatus Kapaibacteriota bacterium]
MLQSLYIKNFALIDEIHIDFQNGLNIVLGETGAGKSIVIDALMATLGERTSPEFVKSGEMKAVVEATFSVDDPQIINSILNDPENTVNNLLILRREIFSKGTTRSFLNDTPYPLNVIKEIGEYLVDFHGQHSHQQLLSPKFQIELLDSVSDTEKLLQNYRDLRKHLEETIGLLRKTEDDLMHLYKENEKISFDLQELLRI